jgi:hypothetical protein
MRDAGTIVIGTVLAQYSSLHHTELAYHLPMSPCLPWQEAYQDRMARQLTLWSGMIYAVSSCQNCKLQRGMRNTGSAVPYAACQVNDFNGVPDPTPWVLNSHRTAS